MLRLPARLPLTSLRASASAAWASQLSGLAWRPSYGFPIAWSFLASHSPPLSPTLSTLALGRSLRSW